MKTTFLMKRRGLITGMILLSIFSFTGSCSKDSSDTGKNEIIIKNLAFTPSSLTVPVNTTVTWVNNDDSPHTVTSNTNLFDSGMLNKGQTYTHQFTAPGIYDYFCTIHPQMTGTVIVQ